MTKYSLSICLFFLASCSGHQAVRKPADLMDAQHYTQEGLQAFAESDGLEAQRLFARALSIYQGIDDQQGVLQSSINLAEVALSRHDYQASKNHLKRAATLIRSEPFRSYQPRITLLYAQQALQQQQPSQAETLLLTLLPAFDNETPLTSPDAIQLSAIATRTKIAFINHQEEALWVQRYAKALALSAMKNNDLEARLLRFQASLLQQQGDFTAAQSRLQQALALYKQNLSRNGIAVTLTELGQLCSRQGQSENAQFFLKRSLAVYRALHDNDKVSELNKLLRTDDH